VRRLCLALLILTAGCDSEARRLLVVDLTLADPLTLEVTAAPWHAAGYRVEYRRFYPHLTRLDLERYRSVLVLGGREPEGLSDALTIGDLAILTEWIRRDGVVVLAYADGSTDRWIMNQWLAAQGAGIVIGAERGEAQSIDATPLPHSALDNAGFAPFPAGRNRPLEVRDRSQTLALGSTNAFVAASRARPGSGSGGSGGGDGLIVVASRSLLSSADADAGTRDFLIALARWTRRPAEWAGIGVAIRPTPLRLADAPQPVRVHPPPLAPPAGSAAIVLPEAVKRDTGRGGGGGGGPISTPAWITHQGMRVLWGRFTLLALDSLIRFVDIAALNALATTIPAAAIIDTQSTRNLWKITGERLQATSVRWFPAVALSQMPSQDGSPDEVDRQGTPVAIACGLDSLYWRGALRPVFRTLLRLNGIRPDVIAGVALDLDSAMTQYRGSGFCDADYRVGLAALELDRGETDRLAGLPAPVRYDTLLERGWLGRYFQALEDAVAERARALRDELRRLHPDLRFAFHAGEAPADWFSLGLLRGLSSRDAPALLWLQERRGEQGQALLRHYRAREIFALPALHLTPERGTFTTAEWSHLRYAAFSDHAGFWLDRTATDSLGRVIRRFAKEALPGGPAAR
jgi:hypothetical protein